MPLLKTPPRYDPSVALVERAEILGATYKKGEFTDEYKLHDCLNPKRYIDTFKVMVDDFGEDTEKQWDFRTCAGEYAAIVKERTEKMFPVSAFKDICSEAQGEPSGHCIFYSLIIKIILEKKLNM